MLREVTEEEDFWGLFCGSSHGIVDLSCVDHALPIGLDVLLLFGFLAILFSRSWSKPTISSARTCSVSPLQLVSALINGSLGILYIGVGVWVVLKLWAETHRILPLHSWIFLLFHGVTWLTVSVTVSLSLKLLPQAPFRVLSILGVFCAVVVCTFSLVTSINYQRVSFRLALDVSSLLGSSLLLFCSYRAYRDGDEDESDLYEPLVSDEKEKISYVSSVTPFSGAGFFSKMSFKWLNELMKRGKIRSLDDNDIPQLRPEDRAESCYLMFMELLNKQKEVESQVQPSLLKTVFLCHWREIVISGFFALLKIVTLSAGPLLLNAFIEVVEGKAKFNYEGLALAIMLFCAKTLESCSQRQWYFRSRLIGLKVRSLLSAAIYKKQLRLSNAAKMMHSSGEITNYVTVDAYRIGEFPFWFHQSWTTSLQLCFAIAILFDAVGLATIASLVVILLTVLSNSPLARLQHKYQSKLVVAQDERLKAISEALVNMKVLKLYAWENHFKKVIEKLRAVEDKWLSAVLSKKSYGVFLFWSSPVLVSAATFGACYFLGIPLEASNVFTFIATVRLVQDPVRTIPDVIGVFIQAKVSFQRIVQFLEAPELDLGKVRQKQVSQDATHSIYVKNASLSWDRNPSKAILRNINVEVRPGEKVAICGEVGSGKSTLLAAILGEVPIIHGDVQTYGSTAYVSQSAWIQTGSIRDNVLFGLPMDQPRYQKALEKCLLIKDLDLLPYGDLTEIGERGVNLSGGQKQRIQLARALYQNADVYLLDDPFSAVDAETAASLFSGYVMEALSGKTVLLVTHQVDFLPAFDYVLFMAESQILHAASYHQLLASSKEFQKLVDAHKETAGSERLLEVSFSQKNEAFAQEIEKIYSEEKSKASGGDQLIKQEQREVGDSGLTPYIQYLSQNKGFFFFFIAILSHLSFAIGQILQNSWMAANVDHRHVGQLKLIVVYLVVGFVTTIFLFVRALTTVALGLQSSRSLFKQLMDSLFRAPMSFYDSTPSGRILSRVSADLSIVDLDLPFILDLAAGATIIFYSNLGVLAVITWQVLFVSLPLVYSAIHLQKYYFSSAKELMRINGTSKSSVANNLSESIAGAMTIRAFRDEERFFKKNMQLIDNNASPFFHNFAANEWFIWRLEILSATVLSSSALCMVLLDRSFSSGVIGMALSYGLSLNMSLVFSIQQQCSLANYIISVERLNQYMHITSEAPEVIETCRPPPNWPTLGKVEIQNLRIKYRPDGPLVLRGISCTFEGGDKIGVVGRTGSGKTTLIGALFRLVEPAGGRILVDGIDISMIGLHDLRSRLGIIPQDPTLFNGTVRFNLDPLGQHNDIELWEVLKKCQLREAVEEKDDGLNSWVVEDGSNWSMGQRQLFCLGRALLRRSKILVLDEATASIDNATDMILQKVIRREFADCTTITVAHRIPTVMDCTKVLAISDGKLVEYDDPMKLMKKEGSLFGQLVQEYWSHNLSLVLDPR